LITLLQVKAVSHERWNDSLLAGAMTQIDRLRAVAPETPVTDVLGIMEQRDVNQVPVIQDVRLLGIITRDHLLRMLYANPEVGAHKATPSAPYLRGQHLLEWKTMTMRVLEDETCDRE